MPCTRLADSPRNRGDDAARPRHAGRIRPGRDDAPAAPRGDWSNAAAWLAAAGLVLLAACADRPGPVAAAEPPPPSLDDPWSVELAAELGEKLGGVTLADLDPAAPGLEIAVVGESGRLWSLAFRGGAWSATQLARLPGEGIVVAGLASGGPGDALVVGGMAQGGEDGGGPGSLRLLSRGESGWTVSELLASPALVHGVAVADLEEDGEPEILAAGFARELSLLRRDGAAWRAETVASLPAAAKSVVGWRGGAAVALVDGRVVHARPEGGAWRVDTLDQTAAGRSRLGTDGERLLVSGDDGALVILGDGPRAEVHRSGDKLRGAVLANLVPFAAGLEAATAGYDGRVVALTFDGGAPREQVLHTDSDRLHHLAAGPLQARGAGVFLVAVGYSGRVLVLRAPGW